MLGRRGPEEGGVLVVIKPNLKFPWEAGVLGRLSPTCPRGGGAQEQGLT